MQRILTYTIHTGDLTNGTLSIQDFLKNKGFSSQNRIVFKKHPERLLLNGEPGFINRPLHDGDILTLEILEEECSEKIVPIPLPLQIVYEDEDVLVLNKPADMPIHPSLHNYENSLANGLAHYFESRGISFVFRCLTRLDRDTSGLTLVAKHSVAAGILSGQLAAKNTPQGIIRKYLAIVNGTPVQSNGTINVPIARKSDSVIERITDPNGDEAITHYRVVNSNGTHSLLELTLETGRTHQIRVHLKHLGHPIIGDYLYNPDYTLINRQALHSYYLEFTHPISGKRLSFTCPLPPDMEACL